MVAHPQRRKRPKLKPHQYVLRFPPPDRPIKVEVVKPHLVFYRGHWHLFRNKWKSQFRGPSPHQHAACIPGKTILDVQAALARAYDRYSYGYRS